MASCAWTRLGPAPASGAGTGEGGGAPAARSSHGVSSAGEGSGALVVFGGEADARVPLGSDAWVLRGAARPAEGCAWEVVRAGAEAPPARVGHAQATVGDAAYIFGGRNAIAVGEGGLNDLYAFRSAEGGRWEKLERAQAPAPRSYHTMAAAEGASTLYSFGGCGEGGRLADLHALDVREPCWRTMKSSPLRGRGGASLFASADGTSVMVVAGFAGEETRDIALFDARKAAWHEVDASAWLCKRSVVAHFRDQRGRAILFGGEVDPSSKGHNGAGSFANDVLALGLDGEPLELVLSGGTDAPAPEPRGWGAMAMVAPDVGVVFGGLAGDDSNPRRLGDAWALTLGSEADSSNEDLKEFVTEMCSQCRALIALIPTASSRFECSSCGFTSTRDENRARAASHARAC